MRRGTTRTLGHMGSPSRRIGRALATTALFAALAACSEHHLRWVDNANPVQRVDSDISRQHHRFYSVCGYSCEVVGVGLVNAKRCFPGISVEPIEGTSDVIESPEHGRLIKRARQFATEYNQRLAEHLRTKGLASCPAGTDWDGAMHGIAKYVYSLCGTDSMCRIAAQISAPEGTQYSFSAQVPINATLDQAVSDICRVVREHGIRGAVSVNVSHIRASETARTADCPGG